MRLCDGTHHCEVSRTRSIAAKKVKTDMADQGMTATWLLANIAYAGMRAQDDQCNKWWRVAAFVFGFPGTAVSWFFVTSGSERAYGIDLPCKKKSSS